MEEFQEEVWLDDLLADGRHADAERLLRMAIASDPDDADLHALRALCLENLEQRAEALEAAEAAIRLDPSNAFACWVVGVLLADRHRYRDALPHAERGRVLEPDSVLHRALLAQIHAGLRKWDLALEHAEAGLVLDPTDTACVNLRLLALRHTQGEEAWNEELGVLSAQYPANEWLRAAQGWGALERGHAGSARGHFEQALALDPTSRWAQDGLIESMKAEHPVYRQLLRLFLWLERLPPRTKWVIILGGLFTYRALRRTAESNPALAPALYPLMAIWVAFVLLSWTADSLSDFVLSRTERGRSMVTGARLRAANLIVSLISVAVLLAVGAVVTGVEQFSAGALCAGLLVIPTAAVFRSPAGWPRTTMRVYTLMAACAGLGALLLPVPSNRLAAALCLLMSVLGSWFGVFLSSRRPVRQ